MKINVANKPVESGGLQSQGEFRIKNSAKAFSILSSGLYSNKHKAILRELGCNAYDSHVEAGKADVPFTVHLPTKLNPTFSVRDYGIGLDHEGVINVYTTYFESTKQDSNDFVGCMGLGSKSPFSYTDNFSVAAIKDGTKRLYSAFINEQGIPSIALMLEEQTDESNGLEVSFAVNDRQDMYNFRSEAAKVYKWFKTKPEITGDAVTIPDLTYAETNIVPGVHIPNTDGARYRYSRDRSYALMGNVAYPIDLPEVDGDEDSKRKAQIRDVLHSCGLVVEFDIGDLDIAASREKLSYIPQTVDSIYKRGEAIIEHLQDFIAKEASSAKTKWDRVQTLNRLHQSNSTLFALAIEKYIDDNPRKLFKYTRTDAYNVKVYFAVEDFEAISPDLQASFYRIGGSAYNQSKIIAHRHRANDIRKDGSTDFRSASATSPPEYVSAYDVSVGKTTIVLQDDKGAVLPRVKAAIQDKMIKTNDVMVFRVKNKDANKDEIYKKLKRLLGNPEITWTSSLPKTNTTHTNSTSLTVYSFATNIRSHYRGPEFQLQLETDIKDLVMARKTKHVYVPLQHKSIDFGDRTMSPDEFVNFYKGSGFAKFLNIDINHVYGVNKMMQTRIKDNKTWVNLFDLLKTKFAKIDWNAAKDETLRRLIQHEIAEESPYNLHKMPEMQRRQFVNSTSPFGKLVGYYYQYCNASAQASVSYEKVISGMKVILTEEKEKNELDKLLEDLSLSQTLSDMNALVDQVRTTYPMLKHVSLSRGYDIASAWKEATDYIKLVDRTLERC